MAPPNPLALIENEPAFSFLGELPKIDREKPKWHCTAAYLRKHRPDIYNGIADALCEPGISIRAICRAYHASHHTVAAVEEDAAADLATRKKKMLPTVLRVMRLSAERAEELAPDASIKDASIAFGIFSEKYQLMSGDVTQRIESIDGGRALHDKFAQLHEEMMKLANARIIGEAGENGETNAPRLGDQPTADDAAAATVESDLQSDVSKPLTEESRSDPAHLPPDLPQRPDPTRAGTGEGGVPSAEPPPPNSDA